MLLSLQLFIKAARLYRIPACPGDFQAAETKKLKHCQVKQVDHHQLFCQSSRPKRRQPPGLETLPPLSGPFCFHSEFSDLDHFNQMKSHCSFPQPLNVRNASIQCNKSYTVKSEHKRNAITFEQGQLGALTLARLKNLPVTFDSPQT